MTCGPSLALRPLNHSEPHFNGVPAVGGQVTADMTAKLKTGSAIFLSLKD